MEAPLEQFNFDGLPSDLKTQVFSFVRFTDWVLVLSRVCSEWKNMCISTTLPKVLDTSEMPYRTSKAEATEGYTRLAKIYNVNGFIMDSSWLQRDMKKLVRSLPRLSWLQISQGASAKQQKTTKDMKITPSTSITHIDSTLGSFAEFELFPKYFPNLHTLYYGNRVTIDMLNNMTEKFEKLKVLRCGVEPKFQTRLNRLRKYWVKEAAPLLCEMVRASKKVAPLLETLYLVFPFSATDQAPEDLIRLFVEIESTGQSLGVKVYCRDIVKLLVKRGQFLQVVKDTFAHNGLPYRAYTYNRLTLLMQAIGVHNIPVIQWLLESGITNLDYELSVQNETSRIGFGEYPMMTMGGVSNRLEISQLLPDDNPNVEGIAILLKHGYDVCKRVVLPRNRLINSTVWGQLDFNTQSVRQLFSRYTAPINWFEKVQGGITIAHHIMTARGTMIFLDLMEKQLSKEKISELMAVQDNEGNTPVHLFAEAGTSIIDRLIPYVKHCWQIKNKKEETPVTFYLNRCDKKSISIKEPKLTRFVRETPIIEDGLVQLLFERCEVEILARLIPILHEKQANLKVNGKNGRAFFGRNSVALFKELINAGIDITEVDETGSNYLHGIFNGDSVPNVEAIEFLLNKGINIDQINQHGETPLLKMLRFRPYEWTSIVKLLLDNGADPNLRGPENVSPLVAACMVLSLGKTKQEVFDALQMLLEKGAKPVPVRTAKALYSPLVSIIGSSSSVRAVKLLIQYGADIHERDDSGNSLLHSLFSNEDAHGPIAKQKKLIDFLLQYIDINDKSAFGSTPLHEVRDWRIARYAISRGADINARNHFGDVPLFGALRNSRVQVYRELLKNPKIDLTAVNTNNKKTVLHWLIKDLNAFNLFLNRFRDMPENEKQKIKAAFSTHDEYYDNALVAATKAHLMDIIKACVEVFEISPAWKGHRTALHVVYDDSLPSNVITSIASYLIDHGADVNAQDYSLGNTPLHYAIIGNCSELLKLLLDRGADPNIKNKAGLSPLDLFPGLLTKISHRGAKWQYEPPTPPEGDHFSDEEDLDSAEDLYEIHNHYGAVNSDEEGDEGDVIDDPFLDEGQEFLDVDEDEAQDEDNNSNEDEMSHSDEYDYDEESAEHFDDDEEEDFY